MKILVTGGAGFIGSHICEAYLTEGHEVVVVDDLSTGHRRNVPDGARFYQVDIRDQDLSEVFRKERPEVVNHQAARANVRESFEIPTLYAEVNVVGSVNLLEQCRAHGVRKVIYASTGGAVYGEPKRLPVDESHPVEPLDPYGASKHHVEHYLEIYSRSFGIRYTTLRYPNVYGPRQDPHGEAGVVAIFTQKMLLGTEPVINGSGEQQRDFVHVRDVAHASICALDRGDDLTVNIGSGIGTSVNEIFEALALAAKYTHPAKYGPAKAGEVSGTYLDASLARQHLGWRPSVPLSEGLADTVKYFRARTAEESAVATG